MTRFKDEKQVKIFFGGNLCHECVCRPSFNWGLYCVLLLKFPKVRKKIGKVSWSRFFHLLDLSYVSHYYGVLVNLVEVSSSPPKNPFSSNMLYFLQANFCCFKRGAEELTSENCPFFFFFCLVWKPLQVYWKSSLFTVPAGVWDTSWAELSGPHQSHTLAGRNEPRQ